jgi:Big-like domain-containing protein
LRQANAALLAAPNRVAASIGAAMRRSTHARVSIALGTAMMLGLSVLMIGQPATTVATAPRPIVPLTQAEFDAAVSTNHGVTEPVTIRFSTPMDRRSVAATLHVEPATAVQFTWSADDTVLTVSPLNHWAAGVFHTVTVEAGALARSGQPLTRPARAIFLTRAATAVSIAATDAVKDRVLTGTSFVVSFARPVEASTVAAAIRLDPPVSGSIEAIGLPGDNTAGPFRFLFEPDAPLRPDVAYRLIVAGAEDADGLALPTAVLAVQTAVQPTVAQFRPANRATRIARDATISTRFTAKMDRGTTARALTVKVAGKVIAGVVGWAENDTVATFTPKAALPANATVSVDVAGSATDAAGIPMAAAVHAAFKTAAAAKAAPTSKRTGSVPISGGGAVGGGSWGKVETYYLGLMNCTRTGGWVTSTGRCSSPGGRNVAPLKLDAGISTKVSRPYAKRLAVGGDCSHFCRSGDPYQAVLGSHLFFQSEKSYNGGHYVNLMNAAYNRVGIGVWVSSGRVRLVIDFYHS